MLSLLEKQFDKLAYQAQQRLLFYPFSSMLYLISQILSQGKSKVPNHEIRAMEKRYERLLAEDLANVDKGYYPRDLLYQLPLLEYLPKYPALLVDVFKMLERSKKKNFKDLPAKVNQEDYPDYYTRNFHWQTDGWFSRHSASLYDASVELLFLGTADIMRRQIIPCISQFIWDSDKTSSEMKLLDLACGTGRTLLQLAKTHPVIEYTGVDLSPDYLEEAQANLRKVEKLSLTHANGEELPFKDHHFDILTCVYLFHELPRDVRRRVMDEMFRVLKPGGLLVIMDSCQLIESEEEMGTYMQLFPTEYHEPYYKDYIRDDLTVSLQEIGFENISVDVHYLSKTFSGKKPL